MTCPLLAMIGELQRRQQELVKELKKKDKEIDDYKVQGVRVSRSTFPHVFKACPTNMCTARCTTAHELVLGACHLETQRKTISAFRFIRITKFYSYSPCSFCLPALSLPCLFSVEIHASRKRFYFSGSFSFFMEANQC